MGMFFNSWKDDDAAYYYESLDASDHYNRGYYDGRDDARKEKDGDLDKAYRKGFEAGRKKAIEELMKKLIDLFGDDIKIAYLDIVREAARNKLQELVENDVTADSDSDLAPSVEDGVDGLIWDDILDGNMPDQECIDDNIVNELEITMEPDYPIK